MYMSNIYIHQLQCDINYCIFIIDNRFSNFDVNVVLVLNIFSEQSYVPIEEITDSRGRKKQRNINLLS